VQGSITCLVGDDHEALRRGVVGLLENEQDLSVVGQAGTGDDILALADRRRPEVVVLDLRMPGVDGVEICREVARRELPARVVVYTAFDEIEALDMALAAGAKGYVLKTAPPQELVRAVRMAAAGQQYVDPVLAGRLLEHRGAASARVLSNREAEVLQLLADGMTTAAAGRELFLSPATVRTYTENAMHKLEARNRVEAVAKALRMGLLT
jgi:DNA-binding NarL/FixJ family response regulator